MIVIVVVVLSVIIAVPRLKRNSTLKKSAADDNTHKTEQLESNAMYDHGQSRVSTHSYNLEDNAAYSSGSVKTPADETYEAVV